MLSLSPSLKVLKTTLPWQWPGQSSLLRFGPAIVRIGVRAGFYIGLLMGGMLGPAAGAAAQGQAAPAGHASGRVSARASVRVPAGALVLDRVTVIDVEHGIRLPAQRVVVVGNRIRALGPRRTVHVPVGAQVVEARGKYLIPGLWDMHGHPAVFLPLPIAPRLADAAYRELLANGVTGMRDAGSELTLDTLVAWKRAIATGQRDAPRLLVSGQAVDDTMGGCTRATRLTCNGNIYHKTYVADAADARHLVDSFAAAGADMIKAYDLSQSTYFAIAAEARRVGIPFGGHVMWHDSTLYTTEGLIASDSGARILDHELYAAVCGEGTDTVLSLVQCTAAAARLRRNHTWVTFFAWGPGSPAEVERYQMAHLPDTFWSRALRYTLGFDPLAKDTLPWQPLTTAERRSLPTSAEWAAAWHQAADSVPLARRWGCQRARLAYAAQLPWLTGPDDPPAGPPGATVHLALLNPVLCGVPPLWALQAATLEPARALGLTDSLGTVAVGKVADLVLLDGDPLEDIWNVSKIRAVVANGRYYDRAALDRLLEDASAGWAAVRHFCATLPHGC